MCLRRLLCPGWVFLCPEHGQIEIECGCWTYWLDLKRKLLFLGIRFKI